MFVATFFSVFTCNQKRSTCNGHTRTSIQQWIKRRKELVRVVTTKELIEAGTRTRAFGWEMFDSFVECDRWNLFGAFHWEDTKRFGFFPSLIAARKRSPLCIVTMKTSPSAANVMNKVNSFTLIAYVCAYVWESKTNETQKVRKRLGFKRKKRQRLYKER